MRVNPGPTWSTAAEDRLEQLAAALGSSDSRRLRNAGQDESSDEDEEGTGNARRAIVSCVKALALLGGNRATAWHRGILAAEDEQQQEEQQQEGEQEEGQQEEGQQLEQAGLEHLAAAADALQQAADTVLDGDAEALHFFAHTAHQQVQQQQQQEAEEDDD